MHICDVIIPTDSNAPAVVVIAPSAHGNMKENERIYREEMERVLSPVNYARWLAKRKADLSRRIPGWFAVLMVLAMFLGVALFVGR